MKLITYSKIGYNAPSQANWAYGIWKVDLIDTEPRDYYVQSYTVKENFGGDSRFRESIKEFIANHNNALQINILETRGVYTTTGTQKITGISKLPIMDSKEFIGEVINWINK